MELLKSLTQCTAPSGREEKVRDLISAEMEKLCDDVYTDALGNLICHRKGNGKKLMLAAHMDEIGVIVTFIDDNGFVRFSNVGGVNKANCINRRVVFENGVCGVISYENKETPSSAGIDKMYIDIGASDKNEAEKMVEIGMMAVFSGEFGIMGNRITSKALDDRSGCYVLIEAMKRSGKSENDVYAVFTVQEEVGLRGARTAAYNVQPDMGISVDVSTAGDTPKSEEKSIVLGKGAAIKLKDASFLMHSSVREFLLGCAKTSGAAFQMEAATTGGTDAGAIHLTRSGVPSGTVSIPTRYIHSQNEMVDKNDLESAILLIKTAIETAF